MFASFLSNLLVTASKIPELLLLPDIVGFYLLGGGIISLVEDEFAVYNFYIFSQRPPNLSFS